MRNSDFFLDGLVGFRYLRLSEQLNIQETPHFTAPFMGLLPGSGFVVDDNFKTNNQFYGGQIGLVGEFRSGPWSLNLSGKFGLGATQQTVMISGFTQTTTITAAGINTTFANSGVYANSLTNGGTHSRSVFSVVPELGLNLGYQVTERVRLFAGYNIIYWSSVVRPGAQIDLGVNPNFLPGAPAAVANVGPARPAFAFNSSDFWAQGINFGLALRW